MFYRAWPACRHMEKNRACGICNLNGLPVTTRTRVCAMQALQFRHALQCQVLLSPKASCIRPPRTRHVCCAFDAHQRALNAHYRAMCTGQMETSPKPCFFSARPANCQNRAYTCPRASQKSHCSAALPIHVKNPLKGPQNMHMKTHIKGTPWQLPPPLRLLRPASPSGCPPAAPSAPLQATALPLAQHPSRPAGACLIRDVALHRHASKAKHQHQGPSTKLIGQAECITPLVLHADTSTDH